MGRVVFVLIWINSRGLVWKKKLFDFYLNIN